MATSTPPDVEWNAGDLFAHFGPIPLSRIRHDPRPGEGTADAVVAIHEREKRLYELVDGVLVEKSAGIRESILAIAIGCLLRDFVRARNLGLVMGADGMARLAPGLVRIPDVSFISWDRLPGRRVPTGAFLELAPNLAVEVLSPSNTNEEMSRKLNDYLTAGVSLVWYVNPPTRTVEVFTSADHSIVVREDQVLNGGEVLPGFELPLIQLFSELEGPGTS